MMRAPGTARAAMVVAAMVAGGVLPNVFPSAAHAQEADPWFGRDKGLHFSATASIAATGYAGTALVTDDRRVRAGVGAGLALGAGIGKEIWDLSGHGDPSFRDLVWDVIGTATGVLVAWTIDWLVRQ